MIAIPNMEKPKDCRKCPRRIQYDDGWSVCDKCLELNRNIHYKYDDLIVMQNDCPLIEIVRCGECKWCDNKGKGRALICTNPYIDMDIHPLDFCSYGERRE